MSAATTWQQRYTPAELEFHAARRAASERLRRAADAKIAREREAAAAAKAEADRIAKEELTRRILAEAAKKERREKLMTAKRNLAATLGEKSHAARGCILPDKRLQEALQRVAAAYDLPAADILGDGRMGLLTIARGHLMVVLCVENPHASLASIARAMGRDHTTIRCAVASYNAHFGTNVRGISPLKRHTVSTRFRDVDVVPHIKLIGGA